MNLQALVRPNIWHLTPYSCARQEYSSGHATVFLDANESPYNAPLNRYPDPLQRELKQAVERIKGIPEANTFLGNGSDEAIDLVLRVFCEPGVDNVTAISPTYGMYEVCAHINNVAYRPVTLGAGFSLEAERVLAATDAHTKVIFLCSPNNPTGNTLAREEVDKLLERFTGIVVMDEAYSDFSAQRPYRLDLTAHPNLIVLNTLSKAWASAAIRLGMAFAGEEIIELMNRVKYPYNISLPTQQEALAILGREAQVKEWVQSILAERTRLMAAFARLPICQEVFPTEANFFLTRVDGATRIYRYLIACGIVVRDRSRVELCGNALRITIGTPRENDALLDALKEYKA
ncbi:MAG: histidinol-phosphate transaminase [Prevotellaceae bacterium]|nr:histidinol-phosphate transaminase [Prevotellaceae bacterium]